MCITSSQHREASQFSFRSTNQTLNKNEIQSFLTITSETAKDILEPQYSIVNGRKRRFIATVATTKYKINRHAFSIDKNRKMHQVVRLTIGILGAIFGGFAIFKLKEELKQIDQADTELKKSEKFSKHIRQLKHNCKPEDLQQEKIILRLERISNSHKEIFARIRRKANISIALLVTITVSAVISVVAAVFSAWAVMGASLLAVTICGISLTAKWLLDSADKGHSENAKVINANIRELQKL
jgi:hypothetical protein